MNKLGFAIKLASQGAGNAIECNKGQWTNKVVDIRAVSYTHLTLPTKA